MLYYDNYIKNNYVVNIVKNNYVVKNYDINLKRVYSGHPAD